MKKYYVCVRMTVAARGPKSALRIAERAATMVECDVDGTLEAYADNDAEECEEEEE